jgi:hypothetical protein
MSTTRSSVTVYIHLAQRYNNHPADYLALPKCRRLQSKRARPPRQRRTNARTMDDSSLMIKYSKTLSLFLSLSEITFSLSFYHFTTSYWKIKGKPELLPGAWKSHLVSPGALSFFFLCIGLGSRTHTRDLGTPPLSSVCNPYYKPVQITRATCTN